MGLLTKEVEIQLNSNTIEYFEDIGYKIPREKDNKGRIRTPRGSIIIVKVEDLKDNSNTLVKVQCDCIDCKKVRSNFRLERYKKSVEKFGAYYCNKCVMELFGRNRILLTKLSKTKSFEQWCIDNNQQDILNMWDYNLNDCKPSEICYSTPKRYYFKCPKNLHSSELKKISNYTNINKGGIKCRQCNSFAQWGIDNIDKDFLEKYWDYEKNIGTDPWKIASQHNKKVWMICQEKEYHDSYDIVCCDFTSGQQRCSYCAKRKIHPFDSLGTLYPKVLENWSNKNKKSPYEYAPHTHQKVYWKCPEGKHQDYLRSIDGSNRLDFRCPDCDFSHGENKISEVFMYYKVNYIPQKMFDGLVGLGGGLLSYDFYLPRFNLLIEFQGIQHEKFTEWFHESKEDFKKQKEHDRRKRQYCLDNNIKLLEIWYWDFDNIESILTKELNIIKT